MGQHRETDRIEKPFDSIESAHEFMVLLEQAIATSRSEVQRDLDEAKSQTQEGLSEALALADYKMSQLSCHVQKSRRILNDLRSIRKLLLSERVTRSRATGAAVGSAGRS